MKQLDKFFNYKVREKEIAEEWKNLAFYKFQKSDNVFSIDTPPPTVSGTLHMGHVFSYVQADIIARYKRMMGFDVFYPIGFDDNGLPTERLVEKKTGKKVGKNATKEEFIKQCFAVAQGAEEEFEDLFSKIGLSVDFSLKYQTISEKTAEISQNSFIDLWKKGLIYKKLAPVYWDTTDKTALAQADIEDKEIEGFQITYKALVEVANDKFEKVEIMTTRPEMLPACVCVLYHPEDSRYNKFEGKKILLPCNGLEYKLDVDLIPDNDVVIEKGTGLVMCCAFGDMQDKIWIERHNLSSKIKSWRCSFSGNETQNLISDNGLLNNPIFVKEDGKYMKVLEGRQFMIERLLSQSLIVGSHFNMTLEEALQSASVKVHKVNHNVKCGERSGKPIEILLKNQWYLSVLPFKRDLFELIKKIDFHPSSMKIRLEKWIEGLNQDWCISRDRFFGIMIPVRKFEYQDNVSRETLDNMTNDFYQESLAPLIEQFQGKMEDGYFIIDDNNLTKLLESKEYLSFEDSFVLNGLDLEIKNIGIQKYTISINRDLHAIFTELLESFDVTIKGEYFALNDLDQVRLEEIIADKADILKEIGIQNLIITNENLVCDTWFTSSITPQIAWGDLMQTPVFDLRPQAHEIIRTWAFYTIVKSYFHSLELKSLEKIPSAKEPFNSREFFRMKPRPNIIPWKNVMLSGWCLASDKTKMSKSKGNAITPLDLIAEKGVDVIRLWCGSSSLGMDTAYNESLLDSGKRLTNKIWNAFKFFNLKQNELSENAQICESFDKWILSKLNYTLQEYNKHMCSFEYSKAKDVVDDFFWKDLCDNYLEIIKVRYYGLDALIYKDNKAKDPQSVVNKQQSAIKTLETVLHGILILYAPFAPFITEELSNNFFNYSIHSIGSLKNFTIPKFETTQEAENAIMIIDLVRKHKADNAFSMNSIIENFKVETKFDLSNYLEDLKNVTCVKNFEFN